MRTDSERREFAFLPWLWLQDDYAVGDIKFFRVGRPDGPFHGVAPSELVCEANPESVIRTLSPHVTFSGEPRDGWTIVGVGDRISYSSSTPDQIAQLRRTIADACELLAFSTIYCNQLFSHFRGYANAALFQPVFQAIGSVQGYTAFVQRRKGSNASHGWSAETRLPEPLHCHGLSPNLIDTKLLHALERWAARPRADTGGYARVRRAIHNFLRAYTDSPSLRIEDEVIYQANAIDALLGSKGKLKTADRLVKLFGGELSSTHFSTCPRFDQSRCHDKTDPSKCAMWNWYIELYDARSKFEHCDVHEPHRDTWSIDEHVLMSVHVFNSALAAILEREGLRKQTVAEKAQIAAYDELLGTRDWFAGREPGTLQRVNWENIVHSKRSQLQWDTIFAEETAKRHSADHGVGP